MLRERTSGTLERLMSMPPSRADLLFGYGLALGLFLSSFARTEFQAVQFMPAFILPQLLVAGLFVQREQMPEALQRVSDVMPFTYAYDGLAKVAADDIGAGLWLEVAVVPGCVVVALALGATTLKRRTP